MNSNLLQALIAARNRLQVYRDALHECVSLDDGTVPCQPDRQALATEDEVLAQCDAAISEAQAVAADLSYNDLKNTGELQRSEAERAFVEQVKWEAQ